LWFTGIVLAYNVIQGIGIAAVDVLAEHTAKGVWPVLGGACWADWPWS
jgi:NCS1 family nucleobase:cation symporter-1